MFIEKEKKVLSLQLLKALYGCLRSALLWYELYSTKLKGMGFVLNPHDSCVADKDINGKQFSIGYFVDDNGLTHAEQQVIENVVQMVEKEVGKITVSRGNSHTFLGMKIIFNDNGTVSIDMSEHVLEVLQDFSRKVKERCEVPG